ncbi:MAG: cytochrome c biogenesis protein [Bacteroidetes bacterium]|nr:cytochrome c biogenesis protein [Bacteroidota bacterium]
MKGIWWKALGIILVLYSIIAGLLGEVPRLVILNETIRVLYYHVPMWFSMVAMMTISLVFSIRALGEKRGADLRASEFAQTGFLLATLGLLTGMVWARFTWGNFWTNDPKLNGTAVTMLIYLAYFVLRNSVEDPAKKARLAAVYNIFAFVMMIVFIGILPRMTDSLHPGNGGNPGFNQYDLNSDMRPIFYAAVLGWILIGTWISSLRIRYKSLSNEEHS